MTSALVILTRDKSASSSGFVSSPLKNGDHSVSLASGYCFLDIVY